MTNSKGSTNIEEREVKINAGQSATEKTKEDKAKKKWQKPKLKGVSDYKVSLNNLADYVIQRTF